MIAEVDAKVEEDEEDIVEIKPIFTEGMKCVFGV